jgi:hypothetical protein
MGLGLQQRPQVFQKQYEMHLIDRQRLKIKVHVKGLADSSSVWTSSARTPIVSAARAVRFRASSKSALTSPLPWNLE